MLTMNIFKFPQLAPNLFRGFHILKLFLLISTISNAQKEGNNWYFGNRAGLDFNGGSPVVLTDGTLNTNEGCATISDNIGNLLFYTDGCNVLNRNHTQMPNGFSLMGHPSSTQSALVVKKPGSNHIYYIFTTRAEVNYYGGNGEFGYSIVDMTLEGGLGNVTTKNILLHNPVTEKITAVKHANGCDIWVITHEFNTDGFLAYLVNSSGVNVNPVISNVGSIHSNPAYDPLNNNSAVGQLKASSDGSRLAVAICSLARIELFDFNNSSGMVSNPITFPANGMANNINNWVYGVEFSPDGTKLYGTLVMGQIMHQYDLMAGSSTDIINSRTLVGWSINSELGALQLGPDGKIYCAKSRANATISIPYLAVIDSPNALGTSCNFVDSAIFLGNGRSFWGLPTFNQSYFYPSFNYVNNCVWDSIFFSITDAGNANSVYWNFDDPLSGSYNISSEFNPYHIYSAPGNYNVQLIKYMPCDSLVFYRTVTIYSGPEIYLGNDTILCPGVSIELSAETFGSTYLWQDGSTNSSFTVNTPGTYWAEVNNACGTDKDSVTIGYYPPLNLNLGEDTVLCREEILILNAAIPKGVYQWQDGSTDSIFTVNSDGLYWVEVTDTNNCSKKDSVTINYSVPYVDLGNDTVLCEGKSLTLDISNTGISYAWQDDSTDDFYIVNSPGLYWVEVSNTDGCIGSDTVLINYSMPPELELGEDTVLCPAQALVLNASSPGASYLWQDTSTDSVFTVPSPGLYWVKIANVFGCSSSDSMRIETEYLKADFGYELIPCTNKIQFLNLSSDTLSCHWNFGDGTTSNENNPLHTYQANEKYKVILIINPGSACADTAQKAIPFENDAVSDTLFIPNVFTPNGDGKNDYFEIIEIDNSCTEINRLMIFNRWGKPVFEAEGSQLKWDGTSNGNILANGVYFYVLEGKSFKRSGSVALLK